MDTVALPASTTGVHNFFDTVEQILVDDGFVSALRVLCLIAHEPGVVRVSQQLVQLADG